MSSYYKSRLNQFREQVEQLSKQMRTYGLLRAIFFLGAAISLIVYFNDGKNLWLYVSISATAVFFYLVTKYQKFEALHAHFQELAQLNDEEIARQNLQLHQFDPGIEYVIKDHNYQDDLDILGEHSLFQLVNHAEIPASKKLLVQWLSFPAVKTEIESRQEAAIEIASKTDWYQDVTAAIRLALKKKKKNAPSIDTSDLIDWAKTEEYEKTLPKWQAWVLNIVTLVCIAAIITGFSPYQLIYLPAVLNGIYLGLVVKKLKIQTDKIDKAYYILHTYASALSKVESENFTSPRLQHLQGKLNDPIQASKAIKALSKLVQRNDGRANMIYATADLLFVLDAHLLNALIDWKRDYSQHIQEWLETVHEFECLISLGAFAKAHEQYPFPSITEGPEIQAKQLGHPLIPTDKVVSNDFHIGQGKNIHVITGSNMSGKSTFERTIGINLALAYLGAPVCAEKLSCGIFHLFTSMRTRDNLEESTSSFYAELKRIRQLLDLVAEGKNVFFLLDEILKGTNSGDRHLGAIALVKKLSKTNAVGLVSTHDIELGELNKELDSVENYSFNSDIIGDKIVFDYKLTPGVCRSFNASQLMKNMGITD